MSDKEERNFFCAAWHLSRHVRNDPAVSITEGFGRIRFLVEWSHAIHHCHVTQEWSRRVFGNLECDALGASLSAHAIQNGRFQSVLSRIGCKMPMYGDEL